MPATKRKGQASLLNRRVRPRIEPDSDLEDVDSSSEESGSPPVAGTRGNGPVESSNESESEDETSEAESELESHSIDASQISFGALARAQASLAGPKKRTKPSDNPRDARGDSTLSRKPAKPTHDPAKARRPSKNAPPEQSSKKPVSRFRPSADASTPASAAARPRPRDPRFGPLAAAAAAAPTDEVRARRAYAFLDEYRAAEMGALRAAIGEAREDGAARERLRRELRSMESRVGAAERKARAERVEAEHRAAEREAVAAGKRPFYLKKSERKRRMLVDQFEGMGKRQVDRAIERRRKKIAGKEKRELPRARRDVGA